MTTPARPQTHHSLTRRLRYRFDTALARGTTVVIAWLGLFSLALIFAAGAIIQLARIEIDGEVPGFLEGVWLSLQRTLDAGTGGGDTGAAFRAVSFVVTLGGIFVVTALIGLVATGIDQKLAELRKGRSVVVEDGHTIVLGWSTKLFTILTELAIANESEKDACVVVMAPRDKVEMEDELRTRVTDRRTTRIVCRTGEPSDPSDLQILDPLSAGNVIVLHPEEEDGDASVVRGVLALMRIDPGLQTIRVIAEFIDPQQAAAIEDVSAGRVITVVSAEIIARVTAQVCRQPGLSVVYQDLLDFDGAEVYIADEPQLVGSSFGDAHQSFPACSVIGIRRADGTAELAPDPMSVFAGGDRVILIAEDDSAVAYATPVPVEPGPPPPDRAFPEPRRDRVLVVGWNPLGPLILRELDKYLAAGSLAEVLADPALVGSVPLETELRNLDVLRHDGDTAGQRALEKLLRENEYDHVMVLCYRGLSVADADARTLVTLLQLHQLLPVTQPGRHVSVVSELLDARDVELAQVTSAQDFVVSERLTSYVLAQLAEDPDRGVIFRDLFDAEGSEVSLQPATAYVGAGVEILYAAAVEAGRRHGHVVIGYRTATGEVVVNPAKSSVRAYSADDQLIVIS